MGRVKQLKSDCMYMFMFDESKIAFYQSMYRKNCYERLDHNQEPYSCLQEYLDIHRNWLNNEYWKDRFSREVRH